MTMWLVALPACIIEGTGPLSAMRRATFLTAHYRWKVFAIGLVVYVVTGIAFNVGDNVLAQFGDHIL